MGLKLPQLHPPGKREFAVIGVVSLINFGIFLAINRPWSAAIFGLMAVLFLVKAARCKTPG